MVFSIVLFGVVEKYLSKSLYTYFSLGGYGFGSGFLTGCCSYVGKVFIVGIIFENKLKLVGTVVVVVIVVVVVVVVFFCCDEVELIFV